MQEENKWNPQVQPDFSKLNKLDKLLLKIDNDIQKRVKDQDKVQYMDTLKKTHDIYQLVLGEIQYQLGELELGQYGKILMKIFTGQNTLLNILLKMRTNLDFNPDKMIEGLAGMKRNNRRNSFSDNKDDQFQQAQQQFVPGKKFGQQKPIDLDKLVKKVYKDAFTDTRLDQDDAMDINNINKKMEELDKIKNELDDNNDELGEFLRNAKANAIDVESSNADKNLKQVLRDMNQKKKQADFLEAEGEAMLQNELDAQRNLDKFGNNMIDNLSKLQNAKGNSKIPAKLGSNQKVVNGELVEFEHVATMTGTDKVVADFQKLKLDNKTLQRNLGDLEKKMKSYQREAEIKAEQLQKCQQKLHEAEFTIEKMKKDDKKQKEEQSKQIVMGDTEKDKFKKMAQENIRMKLKLKELLDVILSLEKENKENMQKFRNFIMSDPNLTEEQKRMLLGKVEELFTSKISQKINLKELEQMSKIDESMLKDKFLKDVLGDPIAMIKQIKQQEKQKALERQKPGYNADFDPNLLGENEMMITRKVKKKIKRLNSKGEWEEVEIEVEEQVVIDKRTGKEIRKRELEPTGPQMDPSMQAFINKHGGMAIGGMKIKKPEMPGKKPVRKDGKAVVEGEWFEDENGKKVRMMKDKNGKEYYEVEEEYIDEFGNKQTRIKRMEFKKDQYGNDITTEEYIDPKTGKKVRVEKRVIKDRDGNQVFEEVTTDEFGNKTIKRTKVKKDKDGNEIIEDEYIDEFGNKKIVRTKVTKDKNGREVITQEIINADGTKTIITEKYDEFGNKIITREIINKDGTKQIITEKIDKNGVKTITEEFVDKKGVKKIVKEKKIRIGKDGKMEVEEVEYDKNGNKKTKNIRMEVDKDGNQVQVEESVDQFGNKITTKTKTYRDADGNEVQVQEIIGADGKKITKTKKIVKDKDGRDVEIEETVDEFGNKVTTKTKKYKDANGNEIIEQEIIGADGKKMIVRKIVHADGTVEEEYIDPETGERKIIKRRFDKDGKEIIEETIIDKHGNKTVSTKVISKDKFGNKIIQETFVDKDGKVKTTTKKITKDKNGNEVVEESEVDEHGNVIKKQIKKYKDKDGNEITEEEIVGADGKKVKIKKKEYIDKDGAKVTEQEIIGADGKVQKIKKREYVDKDGNKIIEEERVDEFGNKYIVKRKINADGSETVEEIRIGKDGKKEVIRKVIDKNGNVQETKINADGTVEVRQYKLGFDDKFTQTDLSGPVAASLEDVLRQMGLDENQIQTIADAIRQYIKTGEPLIIGDQDQARLKLEKAHHEKQMADLKRQKQAEADRKKGKKGDSDDDEDLDVLDDGMTEEQQMDALFKRMNQKGSDMGELQRAIRNQLGLNGDQEITLEHFKDYLNKFKQVHSKCGENCPHLRRWYARLGFTLAKYKRKFLKMKDAKIKAFDKKLPKI